ncbi:DNA cytosine methyltransferase [Okeania sp. SIO2G5]|uniref:DNA cytosine methyltransferase n=1 Tax=Okeania sp. SIO2G5 TaxID=2607796 RepID=UPI0013C08FAC|nr:DNA (cytosine-5-)-methyltransferase [Okeania sp. SIO2G5]NEP76432.1 DNA (cytosine-5-)-methyltransferase [Okeania sp. SIO2G5]
MKIIDLFSGIGGLSTGFNLSGFEIIQAYDNWEYAAKTYKLNHPRTRVYISDISHNNFQLNKPPINDFILIGGSPCQDFSNAGKVLGEKGEKGKLTQKFLDIVTYYYPEIFVLENVPNIIKFNIYNKILTLQNYQVIAVKLNSMFYNTPQNRTRIIFIGFKMKYNLNGFRKKLLKKENQIPTTVKDYFGDSINIENYFIEPYFRGNKNIWSVHEPHPTIRGSGYRPSVIDGIRALTIRERLKIQSFPDSYKLINHNVKDSNQAIGNSVPVNLAKHIASCLYELLQQH